MSYGIEKVTSLTPASEVRHPGDVLHQNPLDRVLFGSKLRLRIRVLWGVASRVGDQLVLAATKERQKSEGRFWSAGAPQPRRGASK